ncbi:MAG: SGNH/GDSL hydrolase family protein [Vulcanimicrobiaceae bacterium]
MNPFSLRARFGAALIACAASGCSGSSVHVPPVTGGPAVAYTAIGASDAVGYGASVPCANPPTVANPTCPGGTGYVPVLAGLLAKAGARVTLDDLGISGAVLGPDILALGNMYDTAGSAAPCLPRTGNDAIPGDFITDELPSVGANATLVTVFAGGNDTNAIVNALGCGAGGTTTASQEAFIGTWIANFGNDFKQLLLGIRAQAPAAKIIVANLPNFALIPIGQKQSVAAQAALAAVSVGIDQNVINLVAGAPYNLPVVDLLCNPTSYLASNFFTDGFHPNDAGYAALASLYYAQDTAATPAPPLASCVQSTTAARLRQALTSPIEPFEKH